MKEELKSMAVVCGFILGCFLIVPWLLNFISVYTTWVNGVFK